MDWRVQAFGPILERTPENLMVQHLARFFDYGKESKVARALVSFFQQRVQEYEDDLFGIERVQPGELIFSKRNIQERRQCTLHIPLFSHQDVRKAISGMPYEKIRDEIIGRCADYCENMGFAMDRRSLCGLINWRGLPTHNTEEEGLSLSPCHQPVYPIRDNDHTAETYEEYAQRILRQVESMRSPFPSDWQVLDMIDFATGDIVQEFEIPQRIAAKIAEDLMWLREQCYPRAKQLRNGQMVMIVTYAKERLSMEQATKFRRLVPVVLTVITPEEAAFIKDYYSRRCRMPIETLAHWQAQRMARVMVEAYAQDGLLTHTELQWLFLVNTGSISRYLSLYEKKHHVVLPCPGTILDAGRTLTHKNIVIQLYLEGYTVDEIAKKTYHSPRAVDNYINTFDSVLILHLFEMPARLMARVLNRGYTLICEHLDLISKHMKTVEDMRYYLGSKGIPLPGLA